MIIHMKRFIPTGKIDTRSGFGKGLLEVARENDNIVGLCADLTGSLKMDAFKKEFPHRFYEAGIAEANMISMAAGLVVIGFFLFWQHGIRSFRLSLRALWLPLHVPAVPCEQQLCDAQSPLSFCRYHAESVYDACFHLLSFAFIKSICFEFFPEPAV